MATIDELTRLRQKAETLKSEADRAAGALAQVMQRLKIEFGCETLEQAEAKLKTIEKDTAEAEAEFTEALDEFKRRYPDLA